eukprot:scaffold10683_cov94-Cyclotella_meneghiniana.AAC.1
MAAIVGGSKGDAVPSTANEQYQGSERGDGSLPSACCVEDVTNLEVSGEPENDDLTDDGPHVLLDQALAAIPVLNGSIFDGDTLEELPNATFTPTIHSVSNESNTSDWRESPSTSLLEPIEDAGTVSLATSQHSETSPHLEDNLEDMASSSVTPPSPTVLIAGLLDDIISAKWSSTTEAPSSVSSTSSPTMITTTAPNLDQSIIVIPDPTDNPSSSPTTRPSQRPSNRPSDRPSAMPSNSPSTRKPSKEPTTAPRTINPSNQFIPAILVPTFSPSTFEPSSAVPSERPTDRPTYRPTDNPTYKPTYKPTSEPTEKPTDSPTYNPTVPPSRKPTSSPSNKPSASPILSPSESPSIRVTTKPTLGPTLPPIDAATHGPSVAPTPVPYPLPTDAPSNKPILSTTEPSLSSTNIPTPEPTFQPTECSERNFSYSVSSASPGVMVCTNEFAGGEYEGCLLFDICGVFTQSPIEAPTPLPSLHPTPEPTPVVRKEALHNMLLPAAYIDVVPFSPTLKANSTAFSRANFHRSTTKPRTNSYCVLT